MASGKPDYWSGVLGGLSNLATNQSNWNEKSILVGNESGTHTFFTCTVPVGYELNITEAIFSIDHPGIRAVRINVEGTNIMQVFMDQKIVLSFTEGGLRKLSAGDVITATMTFSEDIAFIMWGALFGYLEQI